MSRFFLSCAGLVFGVAGLVCACMTAWRAGFVTESLSVVCWCIVTLIYTRQRLRAPRVDEFRALANDLQRMADTWAHLSFGATGTEAALVPEYRARAEALRTAASRLRALLPGAAS